MKPEFTQRLTATELILTQGSTKVFEVEPSIDSGKDPIIYVPGMGSDITVIKNVLGQFAEDGRKSITIFTDRKNGKAEKQKIDIKFPKEVLRKAQALIITLESKGYSKDQKINAVGHSEGGLILSAAALMNPDIFSNIVLVDPAGMVEKHSLFTLAKRQLAENESVEKRVSNFKRLDEIVEENIATEERIIDDVELAKIVKTNLIAEERTRQDGSLNEVLELNDAVFMRHIKESKLRALRELQAVTQTEIIKSLKKIHAKGIGISIIQCVDDHVFPIDEFQRVANQFLVPTEDDKIVLEGVDGVYTVKGNHNEILYNPKLYATVVEQAITALEAKYSKK